MGRKKMTKLYEKSSERIDKELDIVVLMKRVRNMKILLKSSMLDEKTKYKIAHKGKNVIDLSSDHVDDNQPETAGEESDMDPQKAMKKEIDDLKKKDEKYRKTLVELAS